LGAQTDARVSSLPGNLPLSRDRHIATDGSLAYRQNRVRHSTAGGQMFERVDHFSFRDDLLLRDRPHDRVRAEEGPRNSAADDVEWTFRTRQSLQKQTDVKPLPGNVFTVKKLWAAASVHSRLRRSGMDSLPLDRRPPRLTLSFSALG
jgi:hypothetical protein